MNPNFKASSSLKYLILKSFLNSTKIKALELTLFFSSLYLLFKIEYSFLVIILLLIPDLFIKSSYNLLTICSGIFPFSKISKNKKYLNKITIGTAFIL